MRSLTMSRVTEGKVQLPPELVHAEKLQDVD
jgi:hypothetical protein